MGNEGLSLGRKGAAIGPWPARGEKGERDSGATLTVFPSWARSGGPGGGSLRLDNRAREGELAGARLRWKRIIFPNALGPSRLKSLARRVGLSRASEELKDTPPSAARYPSPRVPRGLAVFPKKMDWPSRASLGPMAKVPSSKVRGGTSVPGTGKKRPEEAQGKRISAAYEGRSFGPRRNIQWREATRGVSRKGAVGYNLAYVIIIGEAPRPRRGFAN